MDKISLLIYGIIGFLIIGTSCYLTSWLLQETIDSLKTDAFCKAKGYDSGQISPKYGEPEKSFCCIKTTLTKDTWTGNKFEISCFEKLS